MKNHHHHHHLFAVTYKSKVSSPSSPSSAVSITVITIIDWFLSGFFMEPPRHGGNHHHHHRPFFHLFSVSFQGSIRTLLFLILRVSWQVSSRVAGSEACKIVLLNDQAWFFLETARHGGNHHHHHRPVFLMFSVPFQG